MKGTLRKQRLAVGESNVRIFPALLKVQRDDVSKFESGNQVLDGGANL
jgi:hypothetical protein